MSHKSNLHPIFEAANAEFTEENGYARPVKVHDFEKEYTAIRAGLGLIDNSAIAKLHISGEDCEQYIEKMLPVNVEYLPVNKLINTLIFNEAGTVLAIVWVARDDESFYIFADAGKRTVLSSWFNEKKEGDVEIKDMTEELDSFIVAGSEANDFLLNVVGDDILGLSYLSFERMEFEDIEFMLIRIGYSGEYEYHFVVNKNKSAELYQKLSAAAREIDIELPLIGTGIMDTMMIEMKSLNPEIDITAETNILEMGLHWMVSFSKEGDFYGKEKINTLKEQGLNRKVYLIKFEQLTDKNAVGNNAELRFDGQMAGVVIHTEFSHNEQTVVALALIDSTVAWPHITFQVSTDEGEKNVKTMIPPLFITNTIKKASEE